MRARRIRGWHHVRRCPSARTASPCPRWRSWTWRPEFHAKELALHVLRRPDRTAASGGLSAGRKAVLLLNQRGFAKFLLCRDCGFVPECPSLRQLAHLPRAAETPFMACHHCGYTRARAAGLLPGARQPLPEEVRCGHAARGGGAAGAAGRPAGRGPVRCPSCAWTRTPPRARGRTRRLLAPFRGGPGAAGAAGHADDREGTRLRRGDARWGSSTPTRSCTCRTTVRGSARSQLDRAGGGPGGPGGAARARAGADLRGRTAVAILAAASLRPGAVPVASERRQAPDARATRPTCAWPTCWCGASRGGRACARVRRSSCTRRFPTAPCATSAVPAGCGPCCRRARACWRSCAAPTAGTSW